MSAKNPVVTCTVDQCTHYLPGDRCAAAKISVYNNEVNGSASTSADTLCKSFHPRKTAGDMIGALHNVNLGGAAAEAFVDGRQLTPAVECFVTGCRYWEKDNLCSAGNIRVTGANAANPPDTDCETFAPR